MKKIGVLGGHIAGIGFETSGKGIIVVTRMVAGVSKRVQDTVEQKGGNYLEMQLERSSQGNDRLIVMAGGDKTLFDIAEPYFQSFSAHTVYIGETGSVCTAYLPLQLIKGVYLVGLAEIMHMAQQCGIEKGLICKLLRELGHSKYITNKADKITKGLFTITEQTLEELQENIQLGMYLNQELQEPVPLKVCSAVNQRLLLDDKYDDHGGFDSSIIFTIFEKNEA
ncbi:unnamed protein product [Callosobruchus maculatus]|uniref:6-phosphogluconate dehydrogenase NADP-binding domain-containing protein n=1 Tax=Callosobruchus maculatus TaxID=64391 RepID=A0A653CCU7_CALMS|nr:unnamed protein product [Callosobruchus maculatus]